MNKLLFLVIGIVSLAFTITVLQSKDATSSQDTVAIPIVPTISQDQISSDTVVAVTFDILWALSDYYHSTLDNGNQDFENLEFMSTLLNHKKNLESGNLQIKKYLNSPNEIIKISTEGMTTGALSVIAAIDELIQVLRDIDQYDLSQLSEVEYAFAKYLSDSKEGYKLIVISAPQITSLMFEPTKTKNPTGKIPYTISKEERTKILDEIDRLFGDELEKYKADVKRGVGSYNSIIFSINSIYNNLAPETYEEAESLIK